MNGSVIKLGTAVIGILINALIKCIFFLTLLKLHHNDSTTVQGESDGGTIITRLPLRKMLQITVNKQGKLLQSHWCYADDSVLEKGSYFVLLATAGGD